MGILFRNNSRKLGLLACMLLLMAGCRFYFKTTTDQFTSVKTNTSAERGKNLAFIICAGCHYAPAAQKFMGKHLNDLPKIAGRMYSANLTHSATDGIPDSYSDAELFYLLKTGISKSGKFMPYMMRPMMADEDINDLIVFLRSDDPSLEAADTTVGKTHINFLGRAGIRLAAKPQAYTKSVPRPDETNPAAYGKYLVSVIGCFHCHSKKVLALNYAEPEKTKGYLQGGIRLKDPEGKRLRGPNLTPDNETGIGKFSKEDFKNAVMNGITPSGRKLSPPMPKLVHLSDKQVDALYAYLRSIPAVHHKVRRRK